jgi:CxxC motif-containing protein (DUF1111 family)
MNAHRKLFTVSLLLPTALVVVACARGGDSPQGQAEGPGDPGVSVTVGDQGAEVHVNAVTEAPVGFDNLTNGFATQEDMDTALDIFANEVEEIGDGLGPTYNAQACRECHQNPVIGGASQITEFRTGHFNGTSFVDPPGGSLINDRAIDPEIQERILAGQEVRTFRMSLSLMGDGYVEAIGSNTIAAIQAGQPPGQRGTLVRVPVLEAGGAVRAGRFGWKNQNSSLLSFAADAYLNEMGITSPLLPAENTSNGRSVAAFDTVADPEDTGDDIAAFARFMRSLKAPPVDAAVAATASAQRGSQLFDSLGCAVCHVRTITTAPVDTVINGGTFTVPAALGDKTIHPFSDFLLHDVGTGDGIVQNGGQGTRNMVRTAPLWGLRVRDRLMHDGLSVSRTDAILRHGTQAAAARNNFAALSTASQRDVINFLNSL